MGALDYADCNGIGGWAFDQGNMNQTVTLDVYIDGVKTYSGIQANGDRQDLVGAFGTSAARYHGFSYSFPANAAWKNGQNHTFSVRICGASNELMASPKQVGGCTGGIQTPTPSGSCGYTEGQYLFTFNTEVMYAHFYNGVLYAAYRDGSNFKPRHWLTATGLMTQSVANCFAENDPHTTTPTTTNPTTSSTRPPAPSNLAGNMDWADCNSISGWVLNKNTPNQSTKVDIYINGHLAASNVLAIVSRQDVANAFGISGFNAFGFHYVFPGKYKTGVPLTIGVRYAGTRTHIPGSPKTTQSCPGSGLGGFPSCSYQTAGRTGYVDPESTPKGRSGINSLQLRASRLGQPGSITSKLVPVHQGSELSVTALAYAPTVTKRNLAPQLASAVAGGIVAGITLANQPTGSPDQPHSISDQTIPMLGLSTALAIPLVKSLMADRLPKADMELAFYDKRGNFVHRQSVRISKAAGQDWELLSLKGYALQDGYVALRLENANKNPVWFDQVSLDRTPQLLSKSVATGQFSPQPVSTSNGFERSIAPGDLTIAGTENCAGGDGVPSDGITLPEVTVTASHWEDIDVHVWGGDDWGLDTPTFPQYSDIGSPVSIADNNGGGAGQTGGDTDPETTKGKNFVPTGAPKKPNGGDIYESKYTGQTYMYDGKNWVIVLPLAIVKVDPPANPSNTQTYTFNKITYTFLNGYWTIPYPGIDNEKDIEYVQDKCLGYKRMLELQNKYGKEVAAFVTDDGKVFILPIGPNNTETRSETVNKYFDATGNIIFDVRQNKETCGWELSTFDYSLDPDFPTKTTYSLGSHVHTHPFNDNKDIPSPIDDNFSNSYCGISKYILNDSNLVQYDTGVPITQKRTAVCP